MRLLKNGFVQLHMPRTGGHSLAKKRGVKVLKGSIHEGPGTIPAAWNQYPIISTFRGPLGWRRSMRRYLAKISSPYVHYFSFGEPKYTSKWDIDPTFNLWDDQGRLKEFALKGNYKSWYELYLAYFVEPADIIISIEKLTLHLNKG